tara:strand:- start:11556 stop:12455 length:900 start_codon:yes stop_codon:yes gene_type:complete
MVFDLTLTDSSNLSDMSRIAVASAIANVEPAGPTRSLVNTSQIKQGEKQVNLPLWGRMTANPLTEGVDISSPTQVSSTVRQLTATEHGLMTFLSRRLINQNNENIIAEVGTMQGLAIGRRLDLDLNALFDGVSKTFPGANVDGTFTHIAGATSFLKTDNDEAFGPAPGRVNGVFHPEQIRRFVTESAGIPSVGLDTNAPIPVGLSAEVIENYFRGNEKLFATRIWENGNLVRSTTDDSVKGCIFVDKAFALAIAMDVQADSAKHLTLRGEQIVAVMEWGELEIVDTWATEFHSNAAVIA